MIPNALSNVLEAPAGQPAFGIRAGTVVHSISRRGGGIYDVARRLVQSLHNLGVEQQVFGLADEFSAEDAASWECLQPKVFRPVRALRKFGYAPGLLRGLLAGNLDLLHIHGLWMYPSLANLRWSKKTERPYLITIHGFLEPWCLQNSRWRKRLVRLLYENAHLRRAACLHALNVAEKDTLRRLGLKNPICVIPNGIDLPGAPTGLEAPWSDDVGQRRVLLFLGRLHPKKGLANLLTAWRELRSQLGSKANDWALVIAGWDQGGHQAELRGLAAGLAIEDSVFFPGPLYGDAKKAAFENAEAFVLPSFSEGLPMAVLEAWAYALPVFMTPQCNMPEGFAAGAAVQIETDPQVMAQGLSNLVEMNESEKKEIGLRGRDLVGQQFTWPRVAQQMHAVYSWLLGKGGRPDCVTVD